MARRNALTNHDRQVWHSAVAPGRVELTLFVRSPDGLAASGDVVAEDVPHRVDGVGKAGGENDQVVPLFAIAVQNDLVLGETFNWFVSAEIFRTGLRNN